MKKKKKSKKEEKETTATDILAAAAAAFDDDASVAADNKLKKKKKGTKSRGRKKKTHHSRRKDATLDGDEEEDTLDETVDETVDETADETMDETMDDDETIDETAEEPSPPPSLASGTKNLLVHLDHTLQRLKSCCRVMDELPDHFETCFSALERSGLLFIDNNPKLFRRSSKIAALPGVKAGLCWLPNIGYTLFYLAEIQDLALLLRSFKSAGKHQFKPLSGTVSQFLDALDQVHAHAGEQHSLMLQDPVAARRMAEQVLRTRDEALLALMMSVSQLDYFLDQLTTLTSVFVAVDHIIEKSKSFLSAASPVRLFLKKSGIRFWGWPLFGLAMFVMVVKLVGLGNYFNSGPVWLTVVVAAAAAQSFFRVDLASDLLGSASTSDGQADDDSLLVDEQAGELLDEEIEIEEDQDDQEEAAAKSERDDKPSGLPNGLLNRRRGSLMLKRRLSATASQLQRTRHRIATATVKKRSKVAAATRRIHQSSKELRETADILKALSRKLKLLQVVVTEASGLYRLYFMCLGAWPDDDRFGLDPDVQLPIYTPPANYNKLEK